VAILPSMTTPITGTLDRGRSLGEEFFRLFRCAFDGMAICEPEPWRIRWANPAFWQAVGLVHTRPGIDTSVAQLPEGIAQQMSDTLQRFVESGQEVTTLDVSTMRSANGQLAAIRLCRIESADERTVGMIVHRAPEVSPSGRSSSHASRLDPLTG